MNKVDASIPFREIVSPTPSVGRALILLSALAVIGALSAVACHYSGLGTLPLILSATGGGGVAFLALTLYGIDRIQIGLMLRRVLKEKGKHETFLDAASTLGDLKAIKWLVQRGADPNYIASHDNNWFTPLTLVAKQENLEAVRYLVEHGADINLQSPQHKRTALHEAARKNNLAMVRYLLSQRANPNLQDDIKRTPLHYAADHNNRAMVLLLLKHQADKTFQDQDGKTPYDIANFLGYHNIKTALFIT